MDDSARAREIRHAKIRLRKRRKTLALAVIALAVILVIVLSVTIIRAIQRSSRPPVTQIGPAVPVETDGITPLPVLYDYGKAVPENPDLSATSFDNVLFIGDARLQGFGLYGKLSEADFYAGANVNVGSLVDDLNGGTLGRKLGEKQYAAIYLSVGINELGWSNTEAFDSQYREVVDMIRTLQPRANIYLHLIIPVSSAKNGNPTYLSNSNISAFNTMIRAIAAEKSVYFLDASGVLCDSNGYLISNLNSDGVHLLRSGIDVWYEFLKTHRVEKENYAN